MNKKILFTAAIAALGVIGTALPTQAAPANTGWDDTPDVAVGGGSDTTYLVGQRLEALYNGAPGCAITTSATSNLKGKCIAGQTTASTGNFDHDVLVGAFAAGSGAGINALLPTGVTYNPPIDYARSSRGPSGTEAQDVTFWGYARDGLVVTTFGSRTGVSLTKQNLKDIYSCNAAANGGLGADNWSDFGYAPGPIIAWDMNSASGTTASFKTYLDNIAFGSCVRKLNPVGAAAAVAPFENDVKPILADSGPDLTFGTADDDENNYLWWMSFGNYKTYPYTANGFIDGNLAGTAVSSNIVTVDGTLPSDSSIGTSTYAIMRTLFHVTREADADCNTTVGTEGVCTAGPLVSGTTVGGKGGAIRQFTEWLCRPTNTLLNSVTGRNYRSEIVGALNAEGFQQILSSTGLRTSGYGCQVFN